MELLAPAGTMDAFKAAIENGADAVYLGGKNFSARQSAGNFSEAEIAQAVEYARLRDRKVYVTVNTLIDNEEFAPVLDYAWNLYCMGVDALIVQDLGLVDALRRAIPGMRVHASTQMTIHNADGACFLEKQGVKRVVMAREMELADIQAVKQAVKAIEIEVFVHGALCYSYSGQCLFSSMVGGRSGNRGRCAQPCRLPYDLYSAHTGEQIKTDKGRYILSPSDLCLIDYLPELRDIGVNSLKIEGRMKRPEYVAVVTRAYREVLDMLEDTPSFRAGREIKDKLLKIFNRNFSSGYFVFDRESFLSSKRPNNRGVNIGRVVSQDQNYNTVVKVSDTVNIGDGLEIWVQKGKNPTLTVNDMRVNERNVMQAHKGDMVEFSLDKRVFPHDRVFKTHDEQLISEAAASIKDKNDKKIRVDIKVILEENKPLQLILRDEKGNTLEELGSNLVQLAENRPLDEQTLRGKIDRLGNTPFYLGDFTADIREDLMVPFSEINETRRRAVEGLKSISLNLYPVSKEARDSFRRVRADYLQIPRAAKSRAVPELTAVVSGIAQAYTAIKSGADTVYVDLAGIGQSKRLKLDELRDMLKYAEEHECQLIPALPRIQKPGEIADWDGLKGVGFKTVMIGNPGALNCCLNNGINSRVDYSLNIFNSYTLRYLLKQGAERVCLSPELNYNRLNNMGNLNRCEIVVHGEMIVMTSQYCMLNGVLGGGSEKCSGFCHKDKYFIKDDKGYAFPVDTDTYCRFYVFNSRTLCMIDDLEKLISLGMGGLRIEARHAGEQEVESTVRLYRRAVDEILTGYTADLDSYRLELEKKSPSAFTRGHFYRGVI